MSAKAMSLKEKIKNYAKSNKIAAQVVLQNYMFERFLERLSVSEYSEKFVVKGGMLIAAIVGLDTRSTMDLDTTLKNLPLKEEQILTALTSICEIDLEDDVSFEIKSVSMIRKIADRNKIIDHISADEDLKNMWKKYQKKFSYANDISYEQVIALLREVVLEE